MMRRKRAVVKNTASETAIKTSLEDLSEVEPQRKRTRSSARSKIKSKSGDVPDFDSSGKEVNESEKQECKVESDQDSAFKAVGNLADVHNTKELNEDGDSSDSSSNEFEQPDFSQLAMENIRSKEENLDDFAALEDNMLDDIGRLSESEESDFEDVLPLPMPVKKEEEEKKPSPPKKPQLSPPKPIHKESKSRSSKKEKKETKVEKKKRPAGKIAAKVNQRSRRKSSIKDENVIDVEKMDISQLLAMGESVAESCKDKALPAMGDSADSSEDDSEEDDWEEVKGDGEAKPDEKPLVIPKEGVQITIDAPEIFHRKKRKGVDLEACLKRRLNRNKRQIQVLVHKVHLLCWIAHGRYVNTVLNSKNLMGFGLSLIPSKHCYPPSRTDLDYLEQIVQWFRKTIPIVQPDKKEPCVSLESSLEKQFQSKKAHSKKDLVLMFICMLRSLGIKTRLVLSLQPAPLKPPSHELCSINPKKSTPSKAKEELLTNEEEAPSTSKESGSKEKEKTKSPAGVGRPKKEVKSSRGRGKNTSTKPTDVKKTTSSKNGNVTPAKSSRSQRNQRKKSYKDSDSSDFDEEEEDSKQKSTRKSTKVDPKKQSTSKSSKGKNPERKNASKKTSGEGKSQTSQDNDSDFEPEVISVSKSKGIKVDPKNRKVISSESESESLGNESKTPKKKEGVDVWAEVFLEMEEKWISVDVPQGKVHCVVELHAKATSPVLYIVAFGNDLCLKDVSRRYCPQWLSVTQKKRVEERWWKQTLRPYLPRRDAFDKREEEEMDEELEGRPLPTSISEFKNHPLYALKRHLLKFEAIYPPDAPSIGFVRGEPVYPRDSVYQLHSRETWLKEAKVVRLGEQPYKIVKARPKYDRMSGKVVTDLPLELFGIWQVNDYMPPPAVDGKVPRNEYGNVDLYKPCMLPGGTVHLRLPALNRVAKKLGIDCVPAVTGFDFHSGGSHPTFDGFIVCEEYKETLIEAWAQEQDEQEKRAREKRDKRVLGNWVRLVRGLLIRESLRKKYSFGEEGETSSGKKKKTSKKKE